MHTTDPYFKSRRDLDRRYVITGIITTIIIINVFNIFSDSCSVRFITYFKTKYAIDIKLLKKYDIVNSFTPQELVSIQSICETAGFQKNKINSCQLVFFISVLRQCKNASFVALPIDLFLANIPILYPLKTPENQRFSGVFRG